MCELVHIDDGNIKEVYYQTEGNYNKYLVVVDIPNVYLNFDLVGEVDMNSSITASYRGLADDIREQVANKLGNSGELDSVLEGWAKLFPFKYWPDTVAEYENHRAEGRLDYLGNLVKYNGTDDYNSKDKISRICSDTNISTNMIKYEGSFSFNLIGGAFDCWTYPAAYKEIAPAIGLV